MRVNDRQTLNPNAGARKAYRSVHDHDHEMEGSNDAKVDLRVPAEPAENIGPTTAHPMVHGSDAAALNEDQGHNGDV